MSVLFSVGMEVLMYRLSVNMHMLVNEVDAEQQRHVIQHCDRISIDFNAVIFAHDYGPLADLLNGFQVVRGCYNRLSGSRQLLQEFDQP